MNTKITIEEDDSEAWEAQRLLEKQRTIKRKILHLPSKRKEKGNETDDQKDRE